MVSPDTKDINAARQMAEGDALALELYNLGTGFDVTPNLHDAMERLSSCNLVPKDWFRQNYENFKKWHKLQREIGFVE